MQHTQVINKKIKDAAQAVSLHLNLPIIAAGLYGSVLRGYSDPNSDIDICLLVKRPVSDYLGVTQNSHFIGSSEERKVRAIALSKTISNEIGTNVMIALIDTKDLLIGIMNSNPFSLSAYECFNKDNPYVAELYSNLVKDYVKTQNLIHRAGTTIRKATTIYTNMIRSHQSNIEYRKERSFLSIYWTAHRLLAYMSGDTVHSRSINELLELNKANWGSVFPNAFSSQLKGVIKARVERSHFDLPLDIAKETVDMLFDFTTKVLNLASSYISENHLSMPSSKVQTTEMIDLYCALLDEEYDKKLVAA